MSKLFACIISESATRDQIVLLSIAQNFSPRIETHDDGVLFDVSGLGRLIGDADKIAREVLRELQKQNVTGQVAVAENAETAMLLARQKSVDATLHSAAEFDGLPLSDLGIEPDTLNVFNDLGIYRVRDLLDVPTDELVKRYGREFERVVRTIRQDGKRLIVPNIKETDVSWSYELDFAVRNFEQLIFVAGRGLDKLFACIAYSGLSTEQIDITLALRKMPAKLYEIKTSFPSLEKAFWLKLVNLRIALDPPESEIVSVRIVAHFTKARPDQRGLYAVSRPEPESLLLTVNKLKKLVGENNVGVPVLLNQRIARPFELDAQTVPIGKEIRIPHSAFRNPSIAFNYFRPMIRASVVVRDQRLVSIRTRSFSGRVTEYSGVWRANSRWWDQPWSVQEWDIEVENHGIYRLAKTRSEWFLVGEYD
jgi:protein ImuB